MEELLSGLNVSIKCLIGSKDETPSQNLRGAISVTGVQLSRIEVLTFAGNFFNRKIFWEQFESRVQNKPKLIDSDKLTYLRDALKDSPANNIALGLMQTSETYSKAIK